MKYKENAFFKKKKKILVIATDRDMKNKMRISIKKQNF